MKRYQLILIVFLLTFSFSCRKDNPDQTIKPEQLSIGSYIYIDSTISNEFNFAEINTSSIGYMVHGVGEAQAKIVSYASTDNSTTRSTWNKIKETPVVDNKATITVTGSELASALGIAPTALNPGSQYTIYNEIVTASGKTYTINNTNPEFESAPAFKMGFRLAGTITCPFDPVGFPGDFEVVEDNGWQDFSPGDIVQVTAATATSVTLVAYPNPAIGGTNRQPVTIDINSTNGRATVAQQAYGSYGGATVYSVRTTAEAKPSYIFSCTGDIFLYLTHSAGGDFGTFFLKLKKI